MIDQFTSTKAEWIDYCVAEYKADNMGWHDIQDITEGRCMTTKENDEEILAEINERLKEN